MLVWLPTAILGFTLVVICTVPSVWSLVGIGEPVGFATAVIVSAVCVGLASTALAVAASYVLMRGDRWNIVRLPVAMLLWLAVVGVQAWATFHTLSQGDVGGWVVLLAPALVSAVESDSVQWFETLGYCVAGALALFVIAWVSAGNLFGASSRWVQHPWSGNGFLARSWGEARYALRDTSIAGNAIAALVVNVAIVTFAFILPVQVKPVIAPTAVYGVALFGCLPTRALRGMFSVRVPVQRVIGMSPASWVLSQSLVSALISVVLCIPGVALGVLEGVTHLNILELLLAAFLVATSVANFLGFLIPVAGNNALGQSIVGLATGAGICASFALDEKLVSNPGLPRTVTAIILSIMLESMAVMIERQRWKTRHWFLNKPPNEVPHVQ